MIFIKQFISNLQKIYTKKNQKIVQNRKHLNKYFSFLSVTGGGISEDELTPLIPTSSYSIL